MPCVPQLQGGPAHRQTCRAVLLATLCSPPSGLGVQVVIFDDFLHLFFKKHFDYSLMSRKWYNVVHLVCGRFGRHGLCDTAGEDSGGARQDSGRCMPKVFAELRFCMMSQCAP